MNAPGDANDPATGKSTLLRASAVYSVGSVAQLLGGFVALPIATRILSPTQFGIVATGLVLIQVMRILADGGLPSAVTLAAFREDGARQARVLVTIAACGGLLVGVVAAVAAPWWGGWLGGGQEELALAFAALAAIPLVVLVAGQSVLIAERRPWRYVASMALGAVGAQLCALAVAATVDRSATGYLGGLALGYLIAAVVTIAVVGPRLPRAGDGPLVRWAMRIAWPAVPHALALIVMQMGDRVVIERHLGLAETGRYQVAYVIGALPLALSSTINNAWTPIIYGAAPAVRWRALAHTGELVFRLAAWAGAGIALIAPLALAIASPSTYAPEDLVAITALVAASSLPYVLYLANGHVATVTEHTRVFAWASPLAAVVNIALAIVLVDQIGLIGAAYATVIGYVCLALLLGGAARAIVHVPWKWRSLAVCAAIALVGVVAGGELPVDGAGFALRMVLAAGVAVAGLQTLRQFRDDASANVPA